MILEKAFSIFEDEALHLPQEQDRIKHRVDGQKWAQYRAVIVHWTQSLMKACLEDLPDDVEEIQKAVLYGDAMDDQILGVLRRFPQASMWGCSQTLGLNSTSALRTRLSAR